MYIGTRVDLESAVLEVIAYEGDKQMLVKSSQKYVIVRYHYMLWGNKVWAMKMSNESLSDLGDREGILNKATPEVVIG